MARSRPTTRVISRFCGVRDAVAPASRGLWNVATLPSTAAIISKAKLDLSMRILTL
jgi:hypothetical protein